MNWKKIGFSILASVVIISLAVGCSSGSPSAATKPQIATVQKGNISIQVTGTGSLSYENKKLLSFGQTGLVSQTITVKVSEVLATLGQTVEAGAVLVKADPQNWQDQINADQHALDSKKVSLVQAQTAVINAQTSLANAQNSLASAQNGLATAQTNLVNAIYNLSVQKNVKAAQDTIDQANVQLQTDQILWQRALATGSSDSAYWAALIKQDKETVATATKNYNSVLTDPANQNVSVTDITTKISQINQAQTAVNQAQTNITQSQASVAQAQANILQAQANVLIAQNGVDDAQTNLDRDKESAQTIVAPMKGLITKVNVNVGDIVSRTANLLEIAQPDLYQAVILVTERDIMSVKMDGTASVSFDALQSLTFPAKIIQIAPLATVQQGVVNYQVTVELTSLRPTLSATSTGGVQTFSGSGQGFGGFPTGATTRPSGTQSGNTSAVGGNNAFGGLAQALSMTLKDGLSATVNVPIQERNNVLIVPNRAISRQGRNSTVQVINGATTETRTIQVGISDSINTEVVSGLNEGEQISISSGTSATPTNRPGVPGVGGGFRIIGG